jgi:hypothetical protein
MKYSLVLLMLLSSVALAEGGKARDANPIIGDGCVYQVPPGLDLETCELIPAPNQAGVQVYACNLDVIVFCDDDDNDDS